MGKKGYTQESSYFLVVTIAGNHLSSCLQVLYRKSILKLSKEFHEYIQEFTLSKVAGC